MQTKFRHAVAALVLLLGLAGAAQAEQKELLNVSYDVARDVFKDYNPRFIAAWKARTGESLQVKQSHGGSSKQVRAVADGLEADVVTMNQPTDVGFLADKGLVAKDWNKKFPNNASPYTSTMIFIVRKGNPKGIKDWPDLIRNGVTVTIPHPKNTGNGRNTYLAAWGWALRQPGGNEKTAAAYVGNFLKHVPAFAPAGPRSRPFHTQDLSIMNNNVNPTLPADAMPSPIPSAASNRITVPEIATRLSIGRQAVYSMLERHIIPGIRLGKRWIVTRHAYEQWERSAGMIIENPRVQ